jgi:hypothetical protein
VCRDLPSAQKEGPKGTIFNHKLFLLLWQNLRWQKPSICICENIFATCKWPFLQFQVLPWQKKKSLALFALSFYTQRKMMTISVYLSSDLQYQVVMQNFPFKHIILYFTLKKRIIKSMFGHLKKNIAVIISYHTFF